MGIAGPFALQVVGQGGAGIGGEKHDALGVAFAAHPVDAGAMGAAQRGGAGRFHLVAIQAREFFAAQAGREQHQDDGPVAPGAAMLMRRRARRVRPACAAQLVEARQAIADATSARTWSAVRARGSSGPRARSRRSGCRDYRWRIKNCCLSFIFAVMPECVYIPVYSSLRAAPGPDRPSGSSGHQGGRAITRCCALLACAASITWITCTASSARTGGGWPWTIAAWMPA